MDNGHVYGKRVTTSTRGDGSLWSNKVQLCHKKQFYEAQSYESCSSPDYKDDQKRNTKVMVKSPVKQLDTGEINSLNIVPKEDSVHKKIENYNNK